MPTNITYKNSTLTTITNGQSKILKTIGKYMEDDLIITNMANNQSSSITLTPTTYQQIQNITPDSGYEGLSGVTVTVNPIPSQYIIPAGTITITSNGTHDVSQYADAEVNISTVNNQNKTVVPSETTQSITADTGYSGLGTVTINGITNTYVGSSVPRRSGTDVSTTITSNYYITAIPSGYYAESVQRNMPDVGAITIIPSETSQIAVSADRHVSGNITVAAITPTYVGSEITTNPTITVSGPTVTVPSGYYDSQQTKTIANAVTTEITVGAFTPTISVDNNGLISTNSTTRGGSYMPIQTSGYISSFEKIRYNMPIGASTYQLPTLPAQSFTPSSSTQTVTSTGKYMLGDITVEPIPSQYIVPSGTLTITSVDTTTTFDATNYASVAVNLKNADVTAY